MAFAKQNQGTSCILDQAKVNSCTHKRRNQTIDYPVGIIFTIRISTVYKYLPIIYMMVFNIALQCYYHYLIIFAHYTTTSSENETHENWVHNFPQLISLFAYNKSSFCLWYPRAYSPTMNIERNICKWP